MQQLRRLLWLFLAGFVTAAGASVALAIALVSYQDYSDSRKRAEYKPDPRNYQPPPPEGVTVSELTMLEITRNGGVRGVLTNNTKRKINSFNGNLAFLKGEQLLFTCNETVMVEVEPSKSSSFQMLCKEVERAALTPDIKPRLSFVWVYPSRDE